MEAEAQPLLERLGLEKDDPPPIASPAPAVSYSGTALGLDLHIVCNGESVHQMFCDVTMLRRTSRQGARQSWRRCICTELHLMHQPSTQIKCSAARAQWTPTAGKCSIHNVDQIGTVPAALTAYLALQVSLSAWLM